MLLFWLTMGLIYRHWGLHWTFCYSCFIDWPAIVWRILVNAMLSSVLILVVRVIFVTFESSVDLLILMVCHQRVVWVTDILITLAWFYFCFIPSLFGTLSLFAVSIPFVLEQFPWLSFNAQPSMITPAT